MRSLSLSLTILDSRRISILVEGMPGGVFGQLSHVSKTACVMAGRQPAKVVRRLLRMWELVGVGLCGGTLA